MTDLTVADSMTSPVIAFAPETGLQSVARLFLKFGISGAPVVDPAGLPLGIVTKTDLIDAERLRSAALPGNDVFYKIDHLTIRSMRDDNTPGQGRAGELMSPFPITATPDMPLLDAMKLMVSDDIHRLLVLDEKRRIVGILTALGTLRALVKSQR